MTLKVDGVEVDAEILRNLPNLPGFSLPTWKDRNHKHQTWGMYNGTRICSEGKVQKKFVQAVRPKEIWNTGSLPDSHTRAVFKQASMNSQEFMDVPAWDALDRHVLRFNGYFKESVIETNLENYRVRKVEIFYFLEDDTQQVTEPKQDNSGIPQGTLIRRHKFPAPGGDGYLKVEDLRVGSDMTIYGKTIRMTSCDPFTREYYMHLGIEQDEPHTQEVDPFLQTRGDMKHVCKPPRTYEKIYRECMLGGGHINADMQQFLEKDRKVLRFYAILDDLNTPQFERRPFTILFFIADDTMEMRELYPLNCGRDNFPIFFRRSKMPRGTVELHGPMSQPRRKEDYIHGNELYVGQTVALQSNQFFIYDADPFTREYFANDLGMKLDPKVDVQLPERAVPRAATPPYTGYGSWDDSMSSVIQLIPKPPKKDFVKLFRHEGKILRFTARFANPKPEDQSRLFVFNFHLFDDTLSIHEPPQRNLGVVTGRFMEKGIHMNQQTGDLFKAEDLLPGNEVSIYNHRFQMLDMDEYTRKTFENPDMVHEKYDLAVVMEKVREAFRQQFPLIRDIFRRFDTDHDGVLCHAEFKQAIAKYGFRLGDDEVTILFRHFDTRQDGQISYNEFCDAVLDEDFTTSMLKTKPHLDQGYDANYTERVMQKSADREETAAVRKAVRELGDMVYQKHGIQERLFREYERMTHEHKVTNVQIKQGLQSVGITFKLEDIDRVVLFLFPNGDLKEINYIHFFKTLICSHHDLSMNR